MLRFSIMTGIILSTLTPHSLKALNDEGDDTSRALSSVVSSTPHHPNLAICLKDELLASGQMGPEGVKLCTPDGIPVATLYPNGYTLSRAFFDPTAEWKKEQERKQQYDQFQGNNRSLIKKLDKISGEGAYNYHNSPSTNYTWRAIIDGQSLANLEIGFLALKYRKDSQVLMEVFKGITPVERKNYFDNLCFLFSPKPDTLTTQIIGEEEHRRLKSLEEEIMKLPYDSSKTDLLSILKSLKIKNLFEKEDSQPSSSSQE